MIHVRAVKLTVSFLEHCVEVAEIVASLPLKTQTEIDLVITGAVLHDIGKIKSMDCRT